MTARDVIAVVLAGQKDAAPFVAHADRIVAALKAAGYSIVHESEIHGATRERCAAVAKSKADRDWSATDHEEGYHHACADIEAALRALPDGGVDG